MSAFPLGQSSGHSAKKRGSADTYLLSHMFHSLVKITFSKPCFHSVIHSLAQKFVLPIVQ